MPPDPGLPLKPAVHDTVAGGAFASRRLKIANKKIEKNCSVENSAPAVDPASPEKGSNQDPLRSRGSGYRIDAPNGTAATTPSQVVLDISKPAPPPRIPDVAEQTRTIVNDAEPLFLYRTVNRINKINKGLGIDSIATLDAVVKCFFKMILHDSVDPHESDCSEHARYGETYGDIMNSLRTVVRSFNRPGDKPMTFTRMLLNVTQETFEDAMQRFHTAEVAEECCLIALVSFIGHLYVRKLVAARVTAQVVNDLIGAQSKNKHPNQILIRCACELIHVVGKSLDANKQGKELMTQFLSRLNTLASMKVADTQEPKYPQDIREAIKAVHAARTQDFPARAGTQVLVQYQEVTLQEGVKAWRNLKADESLPVDQMAWSEPHFHDDTGALVCTNSTTTAVPVMAVMITAVVAGAPIAVIFSNSALAELTLKDQISALTGLHAQRLVVFKPDWTLLEISS